MVIARVGQSAAWMGEARARRESEATAVSVRELVVVILNFLPMGGAA
jgi:hypothetical protein